jgi:hypothetical protein
LRENKDEQLLSRYLLEDVSDEERERVEESYLADDDLYMKLLVAEDELIATYVERELSRRDRAKFEKAYLTNPHRLRKVEATRELLEFFAEKPQPAPQTGFLRSLLQGSGVSPWPVYALGGLVLAVLCGLLGWAFVERQRLYGQLEVSQERLRRVESELQRQTKMQTASPAPKGGGDATPTASGAEPSPTPPNASGGRETQEQKHPGRIGPDSRGARGRAVASVLTFMLPRPGVRTRGGGAPESLVITHDAVLVRLSVRLMANEYTAYRVSLQKLGGSEVLVQTLNKGQPGASGERVSVELPASLLTNGDYILKVMGEDQILALHHVTVVRRNQPRK